jgi:Kef-type K+ transport system membrane component KefB
MSNLAILLLEVCVILIAARLVGSLFQRLHQPRIIGEMIAGIMLGPSLLGWLAPQLMTTLFPVSNFGYIKILSQLGLLVFMYIVGFKLETKFLATNKHTAVLISHSSIICPFVLGFLLACDLHSRLAIHVASQTSFALFMGTAMSVTAFPVLARILIERGLMNTRRGVVTIACAAVDDVTAWLLLAVITLYAQTSAGVTQLVYSIIGLALYFGLAWFAVRPGLRWLQAISNGRGNLIQRALIVGLLLSGSAGATEWLGIHALFGAFFAGCITPKDDPFVRDLCRKVEPYVGALLLPIFFALTGLRTSIALVSGLQMWLIFGLILIVAVAGKLGGSMISARLMGMSWREAGAIGVLMNTRGLMELVILNIGLELGLIPVSLFSMMVLMALITTFMTSPVLALICPTHLLREDPLRTYDMKHVDSVPHSGDSVQA